MKKRKEIKGYQIYPNAEITEDRIKKVSYYLKFWDKWMDSHKKQTDWAEAAEIDQERVVLQKLYDKGYLTKDKAKKMYETDKKLLQYPEEHIRDETLVLVKEFIRNYEQKHNINREIDENIDK